jgi:glycosyltransferase involved in cell wall biosynthesis
LGIKDAITRQSTRDNSLFFDKFKNKEIVLSVGRLVKYKGYELLINASKYFSDNIVTIIIGNGPERDNIFSLIKKNNIKNVYLLENINDTQKNELYRKCKIFCLSSLNRQEAFGVVLLEALSFGKPLIVNEIIGSGINWVNKNKYTGLNINMNNSKHFADIVNGLVKDIEQLNKYSKNSRDRYSELFTDKLMNMKINNIYYQLLKESS